MTKNNCILKYLSLWPCTLLSPFEALVLVQQALQSSLDAFSLAIKVIAVFNAYVLPPVLPHNPPPPESESVLSPPVLCPQINEEISVKHLPSTEPDPHVVRIGWSLDSCSTQLGKGRAAKQPRGERLPLSLDS